MKNFGTFLFPLVLVLTSSIQKAQAENSGLRQVLDLANLKQISESRAWKKLMHIEPNVIGLKSTQVTDLKFQLSNLEILNQLTEIEATLQAFTLPAATYEKMIDAPTAQLKKVANKIVDHSQHPICLFPARLKFLKKELPEARDYWSQLPDVNCVFQKIYLEALSVQSVSYVFSSYYSDSPGSAFGHTFFRMNRKENGGLNKQELLDYGVGYAANVTTSNGFLYAVLGLVGGFKGSWSNVPYYYKVREYNDFESRDLWSYDLNLTPDEVEMLTLHLWEVGSHYYTYYFFTQNCAFHMLTLLEAAAPRLHLIENVPFYYVIPADSLKALFYEPGLVGNISYRPSIRQVFLERAHRLEPHVKQRFADYAKADPASEVFFTDLSDEQKSLFLDAAIDLFDLKNPQITLEKNKTLYLKKEFLLSQRAKINYISKPVDLPIEMNEQPANSHGSSRLGVSFLNRDEKNYALLDYRFALHDLLDYQVGLPRNSQLEFFNFSFRSQQSRLYLEEFSLFKVLNLNPVNFFETKPSWGFDLGIQNKPKYCDSSNGQCLLYGALAKYGFTKNLFASNNRSMFWAMLRANLRYSDSLTDSKDYFAPGVEVGILHRFSDFDSILVYYGQEYPLNRRRYEDYLVEYRKSFFKSFQLGTRLKSDSFGVFSYWYF